jgi:TonB family protein
MVELRRNFIFSAVFHTAIIAVFCIFFCRGMGDRVPANFMAVSLFEETSGSKPGYSPTRGVQQRKRDSTIEEVPLRENFLKDDKSIFVQRNAEKENIAESGQGSPAISFNRYTGASGIHIGPDIDAPRGYSGAKRKGESSDISSPNDLYSLIRDAITKAKTYPLLARKRRIEGTVVTNFCIGEWGYPRDLTIARSSGYAILDSEALKIVTKAAPFPAVKGKIVVPITFRLTESAVSD